MQDLPDDIPDDVKKQIKDFIDKVSKETGCSPDQLEAIVVKGAASKQEKASDLPKILSKAREMGLEIPDGCSETTMAAAIIVCAGMLFKLTIDTVTDTNIVSIAGIKFSVTGIKEAKALKGLVEQAKAKIDADPNGAKCLNAVSQWILKKS